MDAVCIIIQRVVEGVNIPNSCGCVSCTETWISGVSHDKRTKGATGWAPECCQCKKSEENYSFATKAFQVRALRDLVWKITYFLGYKMNSKSGFNWSRIGRPSRNVLKLNHQRYLYQLQRRWRKRIKIFIRKLPNFLANSELSSVLSIRWIVWSWKLSWNRKRCLELFIHLNSNTFQMLQRPNRSSRVSLRPLHDFLDLYLN